MKNKSQQLDYWQIRTLTAEGKFKKLQKAILDYFNYFDIHPYTTGLENVRLSVEIQVNKKKHGDDKNIWKKKFKGNNASDNIK